jgi:septum formation protein
MKLILASQSTARKQMLENAGVSFVTESPMVDEEAIKQSLRTRALSGRDLADALAEFKALKLSRRHPDALVLGADQTLECKDGTLLDKPESLPALRQQLQRLSGSTHDLWSAAVLAQAGQPIWRHVERCRMHMRPLSPDFIDQYLEIEGEGLLACVGGYRIEGLGIQLFDKVEGSHFAIMGLPLLPLLDILRQHRLLRA